MDRYKYRVWDIKDGKYLNTSTVRISSYPNGTFSVDGHREDCGLYIIENCAVSRDIHDTLLYVGDIVDVIVSPENGIDGFRHKSVEIKWNEEHSCLELGHVTIGVPYYYDYEKVGNIHDIANQEGANLADAELVIKEQARSIET